MCKYDKTYQYYNVYYQKDGYDNYDYLNHVHRYAGRTKLAGERLHDHGFYGVTGRGIPVGSGRHVHRYMNQTTFDVGHDHNMIGTTGIDISIPGGSHVHDERSATSFDFGHRHGVKFTTSDAIGTKKNLYYSNYDRRNSSY